MFEIMIKSKLIKFQIKETIYRVKKAYFEENSI
jgi:hypothetical protein